MAIGSWKSAHQSNNSTMIYQDADRGSGTTNNININHGSKNGLTKNRCDHWKTVWYDHYKNKKTHWEISSTISRSNKFRTMRNFDPGRNVRTIIFLCPFLPFARAPSSGLHKCLSYKKTRRVDDSRGYLGFFLKKMRLVRCPDHEPEQVWNGRESEKDKRWALVKSERERKMRIRKTKKKTESRAHAAVNSAKRELAYRIDAHETACPECYNRKPLNPNSKTPTPPFSVCTGSTLAHLRTRAQNFCTLLLGVRSETSFHPTSNKTLLKLLQCYSVGSSCRILRRLIRFHETRPVSCIILLFRV